jgi:hypothetical protein
LDQQLGSLKADVGVLIFESVEQFGGSFRSLPGIRNSLVVTTAKLTAADRKRNDHAEKQILAYGITPFRMRGLFDTVMAWLNGLSSAAGLALTGRAFSLSCIL